MAGTNITGRGIATLKGLAKLERLDLQGCKRLGEDIADALAGFQQLRILDVKDSNLSPQALQRIHASLPRCQVAE